MDPKSSYWLILAVLSLFAGLLFPIRSEGSPSGSLRSGDLRLPLFILAVSLILGAYLRFRHLDFGFPEAYHPDEARKAIILRKMSAKSTWDPDYFLHPSLLLYLSKITSRIFYALNIYADNNQLRNLLAGRFVSATAGSAAIGVGYLILRQLIPSALLASFGALLLAVNPLALDCSRYFKEDSLFCFFLLLVLYTSLLAFTLPRVIFLSALFAGLCAGSKYTGIVSLVIPLGALVLLPLKESPLTFQATRNLIATWSNRNALIRLAGTLAALLLLAVIGFIISTPYAVITPDSLLAGFQFERKHALGGHGGISISAASRLFTYHLSRSLFNGLTLPLLIVSLVATGMLFRMKSAKWLLLLGSTVAFYLAAELVKSKPMPQPDRYALPAVLLLILVSVVFLNEIRNRQVLMVSALLVLISSGYRGIGTSLAIHPDTRETMAHWVSANISKDKKILLVGLPNYAPRLKRWGYPFAVISPENGRKKHTIEALRNSHFDYLMVTSFSYERYFLEPEADPGLRRRFDEFAENFELIHEEHSPFGPVGFHNPTLKVYRLK